MDNKKIADSIIAVNETCKCVGEDHGKAVLTNEQVQAMRDEREEKGTHYRTLAKKYGCGLTTAFDICKGRRRNAVPFRYIRKRSRRG